MVCVGLSQARVAGLAVLRVRLELGLVVMVCVGLSRAHLAGLAELRVRLELGLNLEWSAQAVCVITSMP
jgi:hypothetical protein